MFTKAYARKAEIQAQSKGDHVVRDSQTHQEIARGSYAKCIAYMNSFGKCYVEAA